MQNFSTFEAACEINGTDPQDPRFTTGTQFSKDFEKLAEIIRALCKREDGTYWVADPTDPYQDKYLNWFWRDKDGFRFLDTVYSRSLTDAPGGSRLGLPTRADSKYAADTFLPFYDAVYC